ncbi:MAG: hypothetical protein WC447_02335 [Candidatus Paceibacterota bacterium]
MKNKSFAFILCFFIFSFSLLSQEQIKLANINKPGDVVISEKIGIVLAENLFGPHKVVFSGNSPGSPVPVLSREEKSNSGGKNSFDKLVILFSGKIYSPNMAEPILFENKTAEQIVLLEIPVFPTILEQPFNLYLDLKIQTVSKPINNKLSDDAGEYLAVLNLTLTKL